MPLLQGLRLQHKIMGNTAVLMVRLAPKHFEFLQARKQGRSVVALEAQLFSYISLHPKMPLPEGLRLQHKISLGTESTFSDMLQHSNYIFMFTLWLQNMEMNILLTLHIDVSTQTELSERV